MTSYAERRWFVMFVATCALINSTIYLFLHPSDIAFATWSTFFATVGGVYRWTAMKMMKPDESH